MTEDTEPDNDEEEEPGVDISDPYMDLQPVLAGLEPEGTGWQISDTVIARRVKNTDRNLWELWIQDQNAVTVDADQFPTTVDFGLYIEQLIADLEKKVKAQTGELDDDPRQVGRGPGNSFQ